jgi:hypothetical protein
MNVHLFFLVSIYFCVSHYCASLFNHLIFMVIANVIGLVIVLLLNFIQGWVPGWTQTPSWCSHCKSRSWVFSFLVVSTKLASFVLIWVRLCVVYLTIFLDLIWALRRKISYNLKQKMNSVLLQNEFHIKNIFIAIYRILPYMCCVVCSACCFASPCVVLCCM